MEEGEEPHQLGIRVSDPKIVNREKKSCFIKTDDFIAFVGNHECPFFVAKVIRIRQYSIYVHFYGMDTKGLCCLSRFICVPRSFPTTRRRQCFYCLSWCQSYWHRDINILHWGFQLTKRKHLFKKD